MQVSPSARSYQQKTADFLSMVDECVGLINQFGITKMFVDGSAPSFISAVRRLL